MMANDTARIISLFRSSQVDYSLHYLRLFSAYNAWYRMATGIPGDRQALEHLKTRDQFWIDVINGQNIPLLTTVMRKICCLTQHRPISSATWCGYLLDPTDWRGLIEVWYSVRCDIVHGAVAADSAHYPLLVQYAYESLHLFMTEIARRLQANVEQLPHTDISVPQPLLRRYMRSLSDTEVDFMPYWQRNTLCDLHASSDAFLEGNTLHKAKKAV